MLKDWYTRGVKRSLEERRRGREGRKKKKKGRKLPDSRWSVFQVSNGWRDLPIPDSVKLGNKFTRRRVASHNRRELGISCLQSAGMFFFLLTTSVL